MIDTYLVKIVLWAICLLEISLCFFMLDIFFELRRKRNIKKDVLCVICIVIVGSMLAINRQLLFFSHSVWILSMVFVSIVAMCLMKKHWFSIGCFIIFYFSAIALGDFFFSLIVTSILGADFWGIVYKENLSWWTVLILGSTRAVACIIIRPFHNDEKDVRLLGKILFPIAVVSCILVRFFQTLLVAVGMNLLAVHGWRVGVALLSCLVLLFCAIIFSYRSITLRNEKEILLVREEMQLKRYLELEEQSEENNHIIHDVKNHILTLQGLCGENNLPAVEKYLQDMNGMFKNMSNIVWCDNYILNIVLNQKYKEAKTKGIILEVQSTPCIRPPFDDQEMITVVGNLLDNAIEACSHLPKTDRSILVILRQKQQLFNLAIENSIVEKPQIKNNKINTTKADKNRHGYGLKNVARVVDKYDGVMEISATDTKFNVSISFFKNGGK